jgi:hypothetical protein
MFRKTKADHHPATDALALSVSEQVTIQYWSKSNRVEVGVTRFLYRYQANAREDCRYNSVACRSRHAPFGAPMPT